MNKLILCLALLSACSNRNPDETAVRDFLHLYTPKCDDQIKNWDIDYDGSHGDIVNFETAGDIQYSGKLCDDSGSRCETGSWKVRVVLGGYVEKGSHSVGFFTQKIQVARPEFVSIPNDHLRTSLFVSQACK